jgi:hypothetical protein
MSIKFKTSFRWDNAIVLNLELASDGIMLLVLNLKLASDGIMLWVLNLKLASDGIML